MQHTVTASRPAKKSAAGKVESINITVADNGFSVSVYRTQPKGRYESPKPMVFTKPGEMLTYLESCLPGEGAAHEKGEESGKSEKKG